MESERKLVLQCTECGADKTYATNGSYKNAKHFMKKNGYLLCQSCVTKRATDWANANKDKITGRPKGSKSKSNRIDVSDNWGGWGHITKEHRLRGIAHREGFDTYEEYAATLSAWQLYKYAVWRLTYKQPWRDLPNADKRGRCGVPGAYQIDHVVGIRHGFDNRIPPEEIADISNLRMIPWEENRAKH